MKRLFTICAILLAVLNGAAYANAYIGGDFTVYPSQSHQGNKSWIIHSAAPGSVIEESLTLENLSSKRLEVSLLTRSAKEENGKFTVSTEEDFGDVGQWIEPEADIYVLEPHRKILVPVLISIPSDAVNGRYAAAIYASKKESAGASLNIVTQIGVRVYLTVSSSAEGSANIFSTPEYKSSFLMGLSALGLASSIFYYLINRKETKDAK